jgi:dienelactone hydrolase
VTLAVLIGGLLLPAASSAGTDPIRISVPEPTGRFAVGTRTLKMVDDSRPMVPGGNGARKLMVQVTYPRASRRPSRCRPSQYISPGVQPILASALAVEREIEIDTGICRGGRVASGRHPVLIFSHAFTADRFVYATLVDDLASRGYVVVAPDHLPDAFAVEYPNGRVVEGDYGRPLDPVTIGEQELAGLVELRAADVSFVLSRTLALGSGDKGFLSGHVDRRRVGVLGHSLGGATATRVAMLDRRFDAAVNIDGSLFGDWVADTGDRTPFLLLAAEGGIGSVFGEQSLCPYMEGLRGPRFAFELGDALHFSFSDFQALAPELAAADPAWVYAGLYQAVVGTIDPRRSIAAQRRTLARFLARYVKGQKGHVRAVGGFRQLPIAGCDGG